MRVTRWFVVLCLLVAPSVGARQVGFQDALLDKLQGKWLLKGTIGGEAATHDVLAEWVLGHQYMRLHEVAREKDAQGQPAYEALVFIGWDDLLRQYASMWLDVTGSGGLNANGIGHAAKSDSTLAFLFRFPDGQPFHTTFEYDEKDGTWQWLLDGEADGKRVPFARLTMTPSR